MTQLVFACIAPHGSEILEELSGGNLSLMARTRASMVELGRRMTSAAPDVLVVLTPHGTRAEGQFAVANPERVRGEVQDHGGTVTLERRVDRALAQRIAAEAATDGVPVALLNYATSEGPLSVMPLDWGALIPLWFMPDVPVVVINPPRGMDFAGHVQFGRALARAASAAGRRVGLIASADWSHTHAASGPYGFHPTAAQVDATVEAYVRAGDLEALATLSADLVKSAKPDGLWQVLVLAGALPPTERQVELLSYEAPTYFGLLCAAVTPTCV
ncbi:extradiol ring-cleavage dioxygenase [Deinococcus maricopensis]|uniref:Extradiol ring-cleavage dioxygenase class III protein subunit B n=1 Tax=Deinococcus maricopensis (strain DSM 21211 / LMG 22137 / NRRL B-23946 / LB-34) TaxID=709986 RepID=E8U3C0_DEIML|nr:extradiol ring-cleavage dioxygenase [Deinococcus maricopensis]ADV65791.1 Extradiol ring-cleavage dioxygenase class III protein subunit B [Deinococcus maricopensis DSM 21211]